MNIVKKITAYMRPDTTQKTYLGVNSLELDLNVLNFSDGTVRVSIENIDDICNHRYLNVECYVENLQDLMICAQIKEIVQRKVTSVTSSLAITSPIYSRYDRVMLEKGNDCFAAKVFSNFVSACKFDIVSYVDCHSEVLVNLTPHSFDISQLDCLKTLVRVDDYNTIAPDKGALKKNKTPSLVFDKKRDLETGKILGIELVESNTVDFSKEFLVVDDLCEGGGTFLGLHKEFNAVYPNSKINLYVTHGLFTNNAIDKLLSVYSKIFVYIMKKDVYDSFTESNKERLVVNYLVTE